MANFLKKRGQKIFNKFSRVSLKAGEESKEHIKENLIDRFSHIENVRLLVLEWVLLVLTQITRLLPVEFILKRQLAKSIR